MGRYLELARTACLPKPNLQARDYEINEETTREERTQAVGTVGEEDPGKKKGSYEVRRNPPGECIVCGKPLAPGLWLRCRECGEAGIYAPMQRGADQVMPGGAVAGGSGGAE